MTTAPGSTGGHGGARSLSFSDALHAVLALADGRRTPVVDVPLEQAVGHALAAPVVSPVALPPWDNAGMDGFAVYAADVRGARADAPRALPIVGSSVAGTDPSTLPPLAPGTAIRIMTGAPMPGGADAVVRVEDTTSDDTSVIIRDDRDVQGRGNVRPRGEDIAADAVVCEVGTSLRAAHLGVLASVGAATVRVHRRPRVTIVASGDELVLVDRFDEVRTGRRIVSSSSYALPALLRSAGADVRIAPIVPDDLDALTDALASALDDGCDLLLTTGGVSVGAHDYTRDALSALGGTQHFWRARIRPGGPLGGGTVRDVPWLGLPGNPVSTLVTATLFAWPLLRGLGGHAHATPLRVPVRLADAVDTPAPLTYFVRVTLTHGADGVLTARTAGPQGSNLLTPMARADALLVVPEAITRLDAGSLGEALVLPDAPLLATHA
ncbi:MAG: molybdopterin molybdotransferase MoeA [Gemmatimonadetes bacterium]|nr:molybdopterin molybdotransferase MoeA [Gemmatimonadota bacterium]